MVSWGDVALRNAQRNPEVEIPKEEAPVVDMSMTEDHRRQKRRSKYNARPVLSVGIKFASKAEERRYHELLTLQRVGDIFHLQLQPKFVLQSAFDDRFGRHYRAITYTADFAYVEGGQEIVEDVKGGKATQTQQFRIKWKWVIRKYPFIRFELVE